MRNSTFLSIALAVSAAASFWLWDQWRNERAVNQDLRVRVDSLEEQSKRAPVAASAAVNAPMPAPRAATVESPPGDRLYNSIPNYPGFVQARLMKNPEFRKALRNQQRQMIENEMRDLPKILNLSPVQAARLFDLMANQGVELIELQWSWPANAKEGQTIQTASRDLRAQNDADLGQLLGDRNLAELKDFRASLGSRNEVDALRAELARAPEPMRDDQVEPMIAVVYAENRRLNQELHDRFGSQGAAQPDPEYVSVRTDLAIAANERIVESAGALLSGPQLEVVKDFYRRERQQMEANRELGRLQAEALAGDAQAMKSN